MNNEHPLLSYLFDSSPRLYGFHIQRAVPISLGWLNLKWRLVTNEGDYVLKLYHTNRYSNEAVLRRALEQQQKLHRSGLPCPELVEKEGELLHRWDEERYMIMRFVPGQVVKSDLVLPEQLFELGVLTGKMHLKWNNTMHDAKLSPHFVPETPKKRLLHWRQMLEKLNTPGSSHIAEYIWLQMQATETIDLPWLMQAETGWTHRDLWSDNVLFEGNRVSAILDFDRCNWDYLELDVARAVMSWSLHQGHFRVERAAAFIQGYRTQSQFSNERFLRSLQMLWYLESVWWIHEDMDRGNAVTRRFGEEMIWLAQHITELSERFSSI